MFNIADIDKDNCISKEEFIQSYKDIKPKFNERELSILYQNTIKNLKIYLLILANTTFLNNFMEQMGLGTYREVTRILFQDHKDVILPSIKSK